VTGNGIEAWDLLDAMCQKAFFECGSWSGGTMDAFLHAWEAQARHVTYGPSWVDACL